MDPLVTARYADPLQMTDLVVSVEAVAATHRWTGWPDGLIVAGVVYSYLNFSLSNVLETGDGTRISVTITIPNVDGVFSDLGDNLANRLKPVTITKVHMDPATTNIAGTEPWFFGLLVHPRIIGQRVELVCGIDEGRTGASPRMKIEDAFPGNVAPDLSQEINLF